MNKSENLSKHSPEKNEAAWARLEAVLAEEKAQVVPPFMATRVMARLETSGSRSFGWQLALRSVAVGLSLVLGFYGAHWRYGTVVESDKELVEAYFQTNQAGLFLEDTWRYSQMYETD